MFMALYIVLLLKLLIRRTLSLLNGFLNIGFLILGYQIKKSNMSDNGRDFNNQEFGNMAQSFNIAVRTTAACSPCSNNVLGVHDNAIFF